MSSPVHYDFSDGIATLRMDDGKANVFNLTMIQALSAALDQAQADAAGAVVLTGRIGMFSGGFDLTVFKTSPTELQRMLVAGAQLTQKLLAYPLPLIAAVSGHAIAMGVFVTLCADVRIGVDQSAKLHINEVANGMTLPFFAIELCRQRMTAAHLQTATLMAQPCSPPQALAAGLLDEIVPADLLASTARSRALHALQLHRSAFIETKSRLRRASVAALAQAVNEDVVYWESRLQSAT
jgi:enoyl-CoA hydratase